MWPSIECRFLLGLSIISVRRLESEEDRLFGGIVMEKVVEGKALLVGDEFEDVEEEGTIPAIRTVY